MHFSTKVRPTEIPRNDFLDGNYLGSRRHGRPGPDRGWGEQDGHRLADLTITAHLREPTPLVNLAALTERVGTSTKLCGKVALIVGASRGLGAALAQALVLHGATVIATYWKSQRPAEQIWESLRNAPGSLLLRQGDVSSQTFGEETAHQIHSEWHKLDFLICSASPAIKPLWIEPCAVGRLNDFVARSIALVSTPMPHFFRWSLEPRDGRS